jgi:uncharacterized protein (TIGR02284 family)
MENYKIANAQRQANMNFVETSETNDMIDLLNELIATNRGIVDVYQTAVERLENETNVRLLQANAEQHETFVTELSNLVVSHGGVPVTNADGGSLVKRAWVTLKAAVTEGDGPILTTVAQDANNVLEAYGEAMGMDLPDTVRELIRNHMSEARLAYKKLSALSAAYNS